MGDEHIETTAGANETPVWSEENDPHGYRRADIVPKDYFLETLLNFIVGSNDDAAGHIGLTVTSAGVVVSGIAISRTEWMKLTLDALDEGDGEGENALKTAVEGIWRTRVEAAVAQNDARFESGLPTSARTFIHMRDVRFLNGSQAGEAPMWRGSLRDISGWTIGSHNPSASRGENDI